MDDFGMFARDLGFRPQGKSAPMAPPSKSTVGSDGVDRRARFSSSSPSPLADDHDGLLFNDVFGGPPKYTTTNTSKSASSLSDFDYDSIFKSSSASVNESKNRSASPVYDKPVYDEDFFDGLPGLRSKSTSSRVNYDENVFATMSSSSSSSQNQSKNQSDAFDDLLGNLGRGEKKTEPKKNNKSSRGLDDLIPGFGDSSPSKSTRPFSEPTQPQKTTMNSTKPASDVMEDPFVVLESTSTPAASSPGLFTDPLEEISKLGNSGNTKVGGGAFDDIDPLDGFGKSSPAFSSTINNRVKEGSPLRTGSRMGRAQTSVSNEPIRRSSFRDSESHSQKKMPNDNFQDSHRNMFDMPSVTTDSRKYVGQTASPSYVNANSTEANSHVDVSQGSEENVEPSDDVWLSVSEIPLFTQPTSAPPPSRPPPPIPGRVSKSEAGFFTSNERKKRNEFSSSPHSTQYSQSPKPTRPPMKSPMVSQLDELEDFTMGRTRNNVDEFADFHSGEDVNTNSSAAASAAAMKEAMDRAEAKFRHAKEVREREYVKSGRSKEAVQLEKDEQAMQDGQEREYSEKQERLDRERLEEEERERSRLEKEREKRAREIDREKARQAVERATREARERAAAEARLKAERTAVERAQAEVRERAERAAVQRAQTEARERAAAEARERAEKAAAEARERANAEARAAAAARVEADVRRRAERAAVERAAAEARERAAAAARMNQQKNDNDLESFFGMGSRPSSVPRPRTNSSDPVSDPQFRSKGGAEGVRTSSVGTSSNIRKVSSTTNIVDDLSSIFGAAPSSGEFQEVEGESEDRRRSRLERHQRTQERAAKALAEKNQRDLQTQRDQEERHRIAETLDAEIKRWSAGKEGNLRALLSTLQYVLWPECGWQPVSLTDLITGASVKKVYRKATLCIHPDKVQQKGANLQQKYIAEKVFDLLKEAWNKFNSEELF